MGVAQVGQESLAVDQSAWVPASRRIVAYSRVQAEATRTSVLLLDARDLAGEWRTDGVSDPQTTFLDPTEKARGRCLQSSSEGDLHLFPAEENAVGRRAGLAAGTSPSSG